MKAKLVKDTMDKRHFPSWIFQNTLSLAGMAVVLVLIFIAFTLFPRMMPDPPALPAEATRSAAGVPVATASQPASATPQPSAEPTLPFVSLFPLHPGTIWVYTEAGYTQAREDPQKIIRGTIKIEEHIADIQTVSPYTLVHIQGNQTLVSADEGWQENGTIGLGDYEYWYVIQNHQVFLSYEKPDPAKMNPGKEMLLAFQFPMSTGSEWCHNPLRRGTVENPTPDPNSPCESRRVVMKAAPYLSPIGELRSCYEVHDIITSGDVITQFCEGIGIASVKYGHMGTQFGSDRELIQFINGDDGSTRVAETPTVTSISTETAEDVQHISAPDSRWTVLHQKQLGRLSIEGEHGKQTQVVVDGQDQHLIPGSWSPDSRYLLFWQGMNSASVQADGLPLWSLEVSTGKTFRLSTSVLVNSAYSSWAPDGHALVFTNGGYRSAQVEKWLSLYTPAEQQVRDLIPKEKLVPGIVTWSPDGNSIVFAAVDAARTGPEYADLMGWENPAILARRIYRLDPPTGAYQRLNDEKTYQDAPRWDQSGRLYFVQLDQEQAHIMRVTDPATGAAQALLGCQAARFTPAGYYGQIDWSFLFDACPATTTAGMVSPTSSPTKTDAPISARNWVVPAVAVQGPIAYVGIGSRLAAMDIHQSGTPQLTTQSTELPGKVIKIISLPSGAGPRVIASAGRYLAMLDTSTPNDLSLITQSKLPGPITALIIDLSTHDLYAGGVLEGDASKGFVTRLNGSASDTLQLIGTTELPAPVQSLALAKSVLYAALTGDPPKVIAVPMRGNEFGEPTDGITGTAVASMTTTGDLLYIGTDGQMLAYDISSPLQPQFIWQIAEVNNTPIPGVILGFEVRPNTIFTAGLNAAGFPFHLALIPPAPLKTGSMVDTASCVAVSAGQMVVMGDRVEIYDSRDPQNLELIGSYPLTAP